jgi:EmrB/QacA subfamily drug resistance transporter
MSEGIVDDERRRHQSRTRLTALIVACAQFMQNLDGTVIATALPTMARDFQADPVRMNVALTSYLLSLAVFIPISGWMADRFGARRVFRDAIIVFTLGSVLCGLANSLEFLVISRIVQGVGGAMMVPVGRLLLLRTADKSEVVDAMAWISIPSLIGPVVGPPLGGFMVTYLSWRWVFDINVPIGILGVFMVIKYAPDVRDVRAARLDFLGLLWSGLAMVLLMITTETAGRGMLPPWEQWALLIGGLFFGVVYWRHARKHPAPLLDFSLFHYKTFLVSVAGGTMFRVAVGGMPFLLPLMLQIGFGYSPAQSGMITFAASAGAMVMKPAALFALRRFGFHDTLLVNALIASGFMLACVTFAGNTPLWWIYTVLFIGGFFRSLQFTAINSVAYAEVPLERMSAATSLYATIQQVSLTMGVTISAASLEATMALTGHTTPGAWEFRFAFLVLGLFALCSAPMTRMMPRNAGEEMSGHVSRPRS